MDTDEAGQVFNDTFKVTAVDPDGKKFDRVSRLVCTGNTYSMKLTIDVHSEFFRCKTDDQIVMSLNTTIKPNGEASADYYEPPKGPTLLDDYDYAMHGQVFHFEDKEEVVNIQNDLKNCGVKVGPLHEHRDGTASFYLKDTEGHWLVLLDVPPEGI